MKFKDYCSFSPDLDFGKPCCKKHDDDYKLNSGVPRNIADNDLRKCILSKGYLTLSIVYWVFTRSLGWFFYNK